MLTAGRKPVNGSPWEKPRIRRAGNALSAIGADMLGHDRQLGLHVVETFDDLAQPVLQSVQAGRQPAAVAGWLVGMRVVYRRARRHRCGPPGRPPSRWLCPCKPRLPITPGPTPDLEDSMGFLVRVHVVSGL